MRDYLQGKAPLKPYLEGLKRQEEIYPENYVKMHNLENHDFERIAKEVNNDIDKIYNWTAFLFMQKGATMLYMGQEFASDLRPSLFDKELYPKHEDLSDFISNLAKLKKRKVFAYGKYTVNIPEIDGVAYQVFESDTEVYQGIFNLGQVNGSLKVDLPDGKYRNYLTKKYVKVIDGEVKLITDPIILKIKK